MINLTTSEGINLRGEDIFYFASQGINKDEIIKYKNTFSKKHPHLDLMLAQYHSLGLTHEDFDFIDTLILQKTSK